MGIHSIAPPLTSWKSYEYFPGGHNYRDVTVDPRGGPDGQPCVWVEDSLWSIDIPEQPHSILFLMNYRFWDTEAPIDLRNRTMTCAFRGEGLRLYGAKVYFWVVTYAPWATRWHYVAHPIPISHNRWGEAAVVTLKNDSSLWHRSFASEPLLANKLDQTLSACFSYGFSFVGFSDKVQGRIALGGFRIEQTVDPDWPFIVNCKHRSAELLTVSDCQQRQRPIEAPTMGDGIPVCLRDDFCLIPHQLPFSYFMFARATATRCHDLRNAVLMVRQREEGLDLKGGRIVFFVEHAVSETRWVFRISLDHFGDNPWYETLLLDEQLWLQLSGTLPLEQVLTGGYDYFGLMAVGCRGKPSGMWQLLYFTLGPTLSVGEDKTSPV